MSERGTGWPISAAIIVEHAPLNGRDTRPMPSRRRGPRPGTATGITDRRVDARCWPSARRDARASIEAVPGLHPRPRAAPLPFARRLSRQGSLPVRAETRFRGSGRRSRVEPGRPQRGRAAPVKSVNCLRTPSATPETRRLAESGSALRCRSVARSHGRPDRSRRHCGTHDAEPAS